MPMMQIMAIFFITYKDTHIWSIFADMKIDFDFIHEQTIPGFKGGMKELHAKMFFDGMNRVMFGRLEPGASIGVHTHETSSEILFITRGCCHTVYDGERIDLKAGDVHYCPKGHTHCLVNDSSADVEFTAVVPEQ